MKTKSNHTLFYIFLAAGIFCTTLHCHAADLLIKIADIRSHKGTLMVEIMDKQGFESEETPPLRMRRFTPEGETHECTIRALDPGEYVILVVHDKNDNGEWDFSFLGNPKEPYGVSNNARIKKGPPTWERAKFNIDSVQTTVQKIKLTNH